MSEIKWKGQHFTYQVNQNIIGDAFSISDLAEISDSRADQELETSIRNCIQSGVFILILSHNCIRCLNPIKIG